MAGRSSRSEMLLSLHRRLEWVRQLIEEKKAKHSLHSYDTQERRALEWALSILVPYVERGRKRQLRGQPMPTITAWAGDPPVLGRYDGSGESPAGAAKRPLDALADPEPDPGNPPPPANRLQGQ